MRRLKTPMLTLLALSAVAAAWSAEPPRTGAAVDCAKATGQVERLVCQDAQLMALDRRMAEIFTSAMRLWPASTAKQQSTIQQGWIKSRDACWNAPERRACTELSYRTRIVDLQIQSGRLKAAQPVAFDCSGGPEKNFVAAFYSDTEPPSAVFRYANKLAIAFAAPAASGVKYTGANVELWERQGEASLNWFGKLVNCRRRAAAPLPKARQPS